MYMLGLGSSTQPTKGKMYMLGLGSSTQPTKGKMYMLGFVPQPNLQSPLLFPIFNKKHNY